MKKLVSMIFIVIACLCLYACSYRSDDNMNNNKLFTNDVIEDTDCYFYRVDNDTVEFRFDSILVANDADVYFDIAGQTIIPTKMVNLDVGENYYYIRYNNTTYKLNIYRNKIFRVSVGSETYNYEELSYIQETDIVPYSNSDYEFNYWQVDGSKIDFPYCVLEDLHIEPNVTPKTTSISVDYILPSGTDTIIYDNISVGVVKSDGTPYFLKNLTINLITYDYYYPAEICINGKSVKTFDISVYKSKNTFTLNNVLNMTDIENSKFEIIYLPIDFKVYSSLPLPEYINIESNLIDLKLPDISTQIKEDYEFIGYEYSYNIKKDDGTIELFQLMTKDTNFQIKITDLIDNDGRFRYISIYPKFICIRKEFTLVSGGELLTSTYVWDKYNIQPLPDTWIDGYTFEGWYYRDSYIDDSYKFQGTEIEDIEALGSSKLYACWTDDKCKDYTFKFNINEDCYDIINYSGDICNISIPTLYRNKSIKSYREWQPICFIESGYFYNPSSTANFPIYIDYEFQGTFNFAKIETIFGQAYIFKRTGGFSYHNDEKITNPDGTWAQWIAKTATLTIYDCNNNIVKIFTYNDKTNIF